MNTSIRRSLHFLLIACLCALMSAARAQEVESPPAAQVPAPAAEAPTSPPEPIPSHRSRRHSHGNEVVSIGHNSTLAEGERANAVVSIFGSSTSAGEVDDAVVSVFGNSRVTGSVGGATVAVFGSVYVNTKVGGDVVAVLGNVELGPEAEIHGNVVVIGGVLNRDPKAVVHGSVDRVFSGEFGDFSWLRPWFERCLLYGRPLAFAPGLGWAWGLALGFLALYVFLALLFRGAVDQCVQTLERQPGQSILAALLTMLLTPVVFVLLCITVIGIAVLPFLAVGLLCASLFGKVVILASLGRRCTPFLADSPVAHTAISVVVGGLIVLGLYTVPVVGFIVYKLLGILGLGVVMYTLLLAARAAKRERANGSPSAATSPPPAVASAGAEADIAASGEVGGNTSTASEAASSSERVAAPGGAPGVNLVALPRAGFWIRMGALLLDAVLIGILLGRFYNAVNVELIVLAAYGAVMWKLKGTTIGGIVCGLQVVRLDGREIDWATSIVRALSCFLSLAVAGLGFLWIAIDEEKQAWHDKIAGTVVVRAPKGTALL
jgi:uncharacterized RDD family membrane protein YckC